MVIVVTTTEKDDITGKESLVTSHGVDRITGKKVALPSEHPIDLGARFDSELQSWVIHQ